MSLIWNFCGFLSTATGMSSFFNPRLQYFSIFALCLESDQSQTDVYFGFGGCRPISWAMFQLSNSSC